MGNLYLIRHGQASFGAENYDVLSPIGVRQAEWLGRFLNASGIRLDCCVAGDLQRQRDTAQHVLAMLAEAPPLILDPGFNEFDAQGLIRALLPDLVLEVPEAYDVMRNAAHNPAQFQNLFERLVDAWVGGQGRGEACEPWPMFLRRVNDALDRLVTSAQAGQNIAVFTSGGVIAAVLHRVTGLQATEAFRLNWQLYNSSLSHLRFRGTDIRLTSFNSHAHVLLADAPELITWR